MTKQPPTTVRVRFAPSPTGYLHIGGARTVLFNWLLARKTGGAFVLRIEDTDRTRHVEDSVAKILDDLRWLGLTWDEGPEAGGDYGPYFQSERLDLYNRYLGRLLEQGDAYYAFESPEQLTVMREAAQAKGTGFRYQRPDPLPTPDQGRTARDAGRPVVVRFKMPGQAITVVDEILGLVTLEADQFDDFVIQKADGFPTYHFACVVDDELMKITHILRGQEHLMNTPKHIALQQALGFSTPRYAHLPVIFNMNGSKMSKRDKEQARTRGEQPPEIDVHDFRLAGYLPEALTNFIALLGWNPGDDREQFSLDQLVETFSIERVGKTNARFDRVKLLSFNTDWATQLSEDRLLEAFKDYLSVNESHASRGLKPARTSAGDLPEGGEQPRDPEPAPRIFQPTGQPLTDDDLRWILKVCTGFRTFRQAEEKVRFLFTPDDAIQYNPKAVKKVLAKNDGAGYAMLRHILPQFEALGDWSAPVIEKLLEEVCEEKNTKLSQVAQPVRVAITGATVSPSIHESLAKLGKDATLVRMKRCISSRGL